MTQAVRFRTDSGQPARLGVLAAVQAFRRDPLDLYTQIAALPQGMARIRVLGKEVLVITHPEHVHQVLRENHQNYDKNAIFYNNARPFLGNGLPVTHGGEDWLRRRRLMQPAFHRRHLRVVTDVTERCAADTLAAWDEAAAAERPVDLSLEMTGLTMRIMCQILFGADVRSDAAELAHRFERVSTFAVQYLTMPFPPLSWPTRRNRAFHADLKHVNDFVTAMVRTRQLDPRRHHDLLDLLLHLEEDGEGLSRQQVQDELISMFFAGHDTTAQTLAWAWYLLAQHPAADTRLHAELSAVLGGRPATVDDLPRLTYTRMVLEETMRLYPVVWAWMRRAIGADVLGGQPIAPGTLITWSPWSGNRLAECWPDPAAFRPERHEPGALTRHAALPFGTGPRMCIGSDFAVAEASLALATLAQRYRPELLPGHEVRPAIGLTLHPENGIWARLRRR